MPLVTASRRGFNRPRQSPRFVPRVRKEDTLKDVKKSLKPLSRELKAMGKSIWYGDKKRRK